MLIKEISVFLENKLGRLAEVTKILGERDIDISASSIADTTDFGILRLIVDKPDAAQQVLQENGFTVHCSQVIAISVVNKPGGLAAVLKTIEEKNFGIEYMYSFIGKQTNRAVIILKVEKAEKAVELLSRNKTQIISSEEIFDL